MPRSIPRWNPHARADVLDGRIGTAEVSGQSRTKSFGSRRGVGTWLLAIWLYRRVVSPGIWLKFAIFRCWSRKKNTCSPNAGASTKIPTRLTAW